MATKKPNRVAPKIIDVTAPNKSAPAPSARPIVVTNRPVLASDPMIADKAPEAIEPAGVPIVSRQAKTLKPPQPNETTEADAAPKPEPAATAAPTAEAVPPGDAKPEPTEPAESVESSPVATITEPGPKAKELPPNEPAKPTAPVIGNQSDVDEPENEQTDAEKAATEKQQAADNSRSQELEQLVTSGKFNVPINAVQRKRSRTRVLLLCVLAVVLAAALVDAALDSGAISLSGIPHTHFFETK
jgi:hypothetical protein